MLDIPHSQKRNNNFSQKNSVWLIFVGELLLMSDYTSPISDVGSADGKPRPGLVWSMKPKNVDKRRNRSSRHAKKQYHLQSYRKPHNRYFQTLIVFFSVSNFIQCIDLLPGQMTI